MPFFGEVLITGVILAILAPLAVSKTHWTFELLEVEANNQTPDAVEIDFITTRLARGLYVVGGNISLKQDLGDDLVVNAELFISRTGSKNYLRTPFRIPDCKLSVFLNTYYKDLFMESLGKCAENSPQFKNKMEMPLTKRNIILNDCGLSVDNMPSHMTPGYYRLVVNYKNQASGSFTFVAHIEPDY